MRHGDALRKMKRRNGMQQRTVDHRTELSRRVPSPRMNLKGAQQDIRPRSHLTKAEIQ
jgi:hypothetical protein